MNRLLAAALVLLSSCGFVIDESPAPSCVSACGAKLYGSTDCAGFQGAEDRALRNMHHVFGPEMCDALEDWRVSVTDVVWKDSDGKFVGGQSDCDQALGQNGWATVLGDWRELSYFHEVAHHMECPDRNVNHTGWKEDGVDAAIWKAARE